MPSTKTALAGLSAAQLASAFGKLSRARALSSEERSRFMLAANAAYRTQEMVENRMSYTDFARSSGAYEAMYEQGIRGQQISSGHQLGDLGAKLHIAGSDQALSDEDLLALHDLFAAIAHEVNGLFSSSGERLRH